MKNPANQPQSIGYPTLEALIEEENPNLSSLAEHHQTLQELSLKSRSLHEKNSAKQAVKAYDRFFELFDKILEFRNNMTQNK